MEKEKHIMKEENAINFLLYSLLGITLDSEKDELLEAAINRAYRDASSHVLSVLAETDDEKNDLREEATKRIVKAIQSGLKDNETYADWHKHLCEDLGTVYPSDKTKEERRFTYGIAQKWVNMTIKYTCVMKSIFEKYKPEDKWNEWEVWRFIEKNKEHLHIPIDNFIMKAASDEKIALLQNDNENKRYGCYSGRMAWSKYDLYEDYLNLQSKLKNKLKDLKKAPLDWESEEWIRVSKALKK